MKTIVAPKKCSECDHSTKLFCCLSLREKENISEGKGFEFFKKGEEIFSEGGYSRHVYCISKGKIKIAKLGKDGKEQITRLANAGEIIGYRAFLNNDTYKTFAIALEDSYVCKISKDKFMTTLGENKDLSFKLLQLVANDLKVAEQHIIDIAQNTVKERVARSLLEMANSFGYLCDMQTINVKMTRSEIADMSGTTTESVIRSLAQLNKEKIIHLKGKDIRVLNLKQLEYLAEGEV